MNNPSKEAEMKPLNEINYPVGGQPTRRQMSQLRMHIDSLQKDLAEANDRSYMWSNYAKDYMSERDGLKSKLLATQAALDEAERALKTVHHEYGEGIEEALDTIAKLKESK